MSQWSAWRDHDESTKALVAKARQVVARTTEVEELRAAQAVLPPGLGVGNPGANGGHPGRAGRATVPRLQAALAQVRGTAQGDAAPIRI